MRIEVAKFLVNATESVGNQEIDLREDYSGRGMYGRTTAGVVVSSVPMLLADVVQYIKDMVGDNPEFVNEIPDFDDFRTDNMAMQTILY